MARRKADPATETETAQEMTQQNEQAAPKTTKTSVVQAERKTGKELLAIIDSCKDGSTLDTQKALLAAGYYAEVTDNATGEKTIKPAKQAFFEAMSAALAGIEIAPLKREGGTRTYNREPIVKSSDTTGNIVVGGRHAALAGFPGGSQIRIHAVAGQITLTLDAGQPEGAEGGEDDLGL